MESEQFKQDLDTIFTFAPAHFLILKPDAPRYTIVEATNAYLALTLTKREEIIGKGLFDVFPDSPDDTEGKGSRDLKNSLKIAIDTKQPHIMPLLKYSIRLPEERGGGFEEHYWEPKNTPVLNDKNEVIYIINQAENVTDSIHLAKENERKSLLIKENEDRINSILDSLLRYTTLDFSQKIIPSDKGDEIDAIICGLNSVIEELEFHMKQLKGLNTELEYANKELDSFSYSVSHDLRAPLRAINGYSQVLMEDYGTKLDEEGVATINTIIRNATKMGALIDDLLTFSRVGKQNLTKVMLNMGNMVEVIVQDFKMQPQKNKIEFHIEPIENTEGDNSMLKQVFTNLISNAIKYSGKKEKSIVTIGSYKKDDHIIYYVKDNGAGFDMKYYDKLFGVFQRLHSSNEFDGTGVGLALVQRIVRKHHGDVWAEAKLDEGATFFFSLPTKTTH